MIGSEIKKDFLESRFLMNDPKVPFIWRRKGSDQWNTSFGDFEFIGIVRSFDPNGVLRLEISDTDVKILEQNSGEGEGKSISDGSQQ